MAVERAISVPTCERSSRTVLRAIVILRAKIVGRVSGPFKSPLVIFVVEFCAAKVLESRPDSGVRAG